MGGNFVKHPSIKKVDIFEKIEYVGFSFEKIKCYGDIDKSKLSSKKQPAEKQFFSGYLVSYHNKQGKIIYFPAQSRFASAYFFKSKPLILHKKKKNKLENTSLCPHG